MGVGTPGRVPEVTVRQPKEADVPTQGCAGAELGLPEATGGAERQTGPPARPSGAENLLQDCIVISGAHLHGVECRGNGLSTQVTEADPPHTHPTVLVAGDCCVSLP